MNIALYISMVNTRLAVGVCSIACLSHNSLHGSVHEHEIRVGYHIVIVERGPLKDAIYERAEKEILYLLRKSKLLV